MLIKNIFLSPEKSMIVIESNADNFRLHNIIRKNSGTKPTLSISHIEKSAIKDNITGSKKILDIADNDKCRIAFNEITKTAVKKAVDSPREVNVNLVDAQQARRILDRIVGYKLSPLLWKKIKKVGNFFYSPTLPITFNFTKPL